MTPRRSRLAGGSLVSALLLAALLPDAAAAHGLVGRADLPVPEWLFAWAAATVLVVSFVALGVLWNRPQLEEPHERPLLALPAWVDALCGVLGIALFVAVVYAGLKGTIIPTSNLAPTFIYVVFWVGVPVLSVLLGDVFRAFSPWRAVARAVRWVAARVRARDLPAPLPYPAALGRWPAAVGIAAFAWVELAYGGRDDPNKLAIMALAYAAFQLLGMALYGIEAWSARADAFGVYFGLFGRLAAFTRRGREVFVRRPLSGTTSLEVVPGTVALLCAAIGSTTFDGASQGSLWANAAPDLQRFFTDLGTSLPTAIELASTVGLLAGFALVAGVYWAGVLGMRTVSAGHSARELATRFVHSLIPIAFAYAVAHYFSLLVYQGQATAYLLSDPLGDGSNIFGTGNATIDYGVISATGIWYVQIAALVGGHVAALLLAHDRALSVYGRPREAALSQRWMLVVMVAFTSLGLWLISAANA